MLARPSSGFCNARTEFFANLLVVLMRIYNL
jgi:hypothetical protein